MSDQSNFTFVFTDIEGSSRLWEEDAESMRLALARHDTLLHDIFSTHGGHVFKTMGDSVLVAFDEPESALFAVVQGQRALLAEDWETKRPLKVRAALHRGPAEQRDGDYFGPTLNRTARLLSAGHGGQTLLSRSAREAISLPEGFTARDLGERRLRDLTRPERIFQLVAPGLPTDFPPLRSLEVLPNNLPAQLTTFVGREHELAEVKRLLSSSRLVTLTGPGGGGKTRLSLQVAADLLESMADGAWLVELATVSDPALVGSTIASALGAREDAERPIDDSLLEFLRSKELLLILDNCEHLVAACAQLSDRLLRGAPRLRILASSREALAIAGETTFPVPPLSMPDFFSKPASRQKAAAEFAQFESVRLFIDRAAAVVPGFKLTDENALTIAKICWRLDGIPLAIELAAPRVKMLTPEQILQRLDDRFRLLTSGGRTALPRQQTLTALIDWSYDLLSEKERALLRRLSVFGGGRTLSAIEEVCAGDGVEDWEILDLLQQLIDKSLVNTEQEESGSVRYFLLESVWVYAGAKLHEAGEEQRYRMAHLQFYRRLAEEAEPELSSHRQVEWIERLAVEYLNFRLALEWAAENAEAVADGLRLAGAIARFWEVRQHWKEGREHYEALLAHPAAEPLKAERAKALFCAGRLAWYQDQEPIARKHHLAALELLREVGDRRREALVLAYLGFTEWSEGFVEKAREYFDSAVALGEEIGEKRPVAWAKAGLGSIRHAAGDHDGAWKLKLESLELYRQLGDRWIAGLASWSSTRVAIARADFVSARALLNESAAAAEALGNEWSVPLVLEGFGDLASAQREFVRAAWFYAAAADIRERLGMVVPPGERATYDAAVQRIREGLSVAAFEEAWAAGRELSSDEALRVAMAAGA